MQVFVMEYLSTLLVLIDGVVMPVILVPGNHRNLEERWAVTSRQKN